MTTQEMIVALSDRDEHRECYLPDYKADAIAARLKALEDACRWHKPSEKMPPPGEWVEGRYDIDENRSDLERLVLEKDGAWWNAGTTMMPPDYWRAILDAAREVGK